MTFQNFLFDLDGTLTDPGLGITNSILYALKKYGISAPPREALYSFIGPPLLDSFQQYCKVGKAEAARLVSYYREYFSEQGLFENSIYPTIPETLRQLKARGAALFVATSKPEPYAKQILAHFGLNEYFSFIGGALMDETRTKKEDVIAYVLLKTGVAPPNTLMVGDRIYDIDGARANGLAAAAVLYGYGDELELKSADYLIAKPQDLLTL